MNTLVQDRDVGSAQKARITDQERARRAASVNCARGSVRLEGFILNAQAEALFARYIDGELTRPQLNAAVLKLARGYGG